MSIDVAVVPVAGRGTRLLPLTKSQPKEMLPVGRQPVVQYVAEELVQSGVRRLLFITGPGKTAIENHFDIDEGLIWNLRENGQEDLLATLSFEREEVDYFYTRQRRQLGLGHAILCAGPMVSHQSFVVALGDSIIGLHAQSRIVARMNEVFVREQADAVIAFETVPRDEVVHYGIASVKRQRDEFLELDGLIEKPTVEEAPSCLAVAARYVFRPVILDYLARTGVGKGNEIQLTDAVGELIRDGGRVLGLTLPAGERRFDIGNFPSYFRAFCEFALEDPQYGKQLRSFVRRLLERPGA
jgi:UTP--glucose-1-phosphate uridylyltransferase